MEISFHELLEKLKNSDESVENDSMAAIRNGIGIREDFWTDFLLFLNDSKGISSLLDIPIEKISSWHDKIKHNIKKVEKADNNVVTKDRGKVMKTGAKNNV